ncbi:MAG TPA: sensor histidine kinase [Burkholderiaceae bacterium]|nr:sensor histidine kinase [Burkholderiaceae bacterium]
MSLRLKIQLIVVALTLMFIGAVVTLQYRAFKESVNEEVIAANRVAAQLLNRTAWLYAAQGTPAMLAFLQGVGRIRSNDVILLDASGNELYRSPPSAYKSGRDAPDWFADMIAPRITEQAISFPDGKLVMRANASRAVLDAWDWFVELVSGAILLLVAVNALVFWLVGRAVEPFAQIVGALKDVESGRFDVALPTLHGIEANAIGAAFNRMVRVLGMQLETEKRAIRAEAQLSDSRELARWVDHHIEQERRMIARELHDELGQSVTAMRSIALSIAQRVHGHDAPAEAAARTIADEASRLYDAMHGLIPRLAPLVLDNFGLADALNDLAARTRQAHTGVQVDVDVSLGDLQLGSDAALALYRAAQEGITNSLRHGRAQRLGLSLHAHGDAVSLELVDDGQGLAADWAERPGPHGLNWLRERVESLGGSFALEPVVPHGVRLRAQLRAPDSGGDAAATVVPTAGAVR